jgi:pimeloyl-ACP methyl ester carboxylesterase
VPWFRRQDLELHYGERGDPNGEPIVLLHGLLWSSRMLDRLAGHLGDRRILLLDLHGHGPSSRPTDPARYAWHELAADVTALLDHVGLERAVVGGLSLGANVALATAVQAPERVRAMILEMPVLRRGHPTGQAAFGALARVYGAGAPVLGPLAGAVARFPLPRVPELVAVRDVLSADPRAAAALLRGLLDDEPVPEDDATLAGLTMPALVIGHGGDPLHALDDARDLAERLPEGELLEARSIIDHRVRTGALAGHLRRFLDALPAG